MVAGALSEFVHRWELGSSGRTLLLLHGTGGDEDDLIPLGTTIDPEANLLSVRGRVDEHGSHRFFRRIREGVFDQESLRAETEALARFIGAAVSHYGFDAQRIVAAGFSNGANMATSLLLRHPGLLAGAFLMRGTVPFEPDRPADLTGTSVLVASGETDPLVPHAQAERLAAILAERGARVDHLWLPTGHTLTRNELERARDWLRLLS